ncbi:hypothetical protein HY624_01460 [Candidatus Uhrbacteria bacterium]|nr:hypothetical protein [Candidatus Uhrbacteria bacterium]
MRKKEEKKQLSLTKQVLSFIAAKCIEAGAGLITATVNSIEYPHVFPEFVEGIRAERAYWEHKRVHRAIQELHRHKFITMRKKGNKLVIQLTEDGRIHYLRQQIQCASSCIPGECIMVTFDIPEAARSARLHFRRFLKDCNFYQLQKSVWVCEKAVLPNLLQFIDITNVGQWVHAFVAKEVKHPKLKKKK